MLGIVWEKERLYVQITSSRATWSRDRSCYELFVQNRLDHSFDPTDETRWLTWLATATAFAFHGQGGRLNVYQETRRGGKTYWYAYHTARGRTRKRYLGQTDAITFARLEEVAQALAVELAPEPSVSVSVDLVKETVSSIGSTETKLSLMPLPTRLAAPHLSTILVTRERLLRRLDEALTHRLTLGSASAGWGKTTLLTSWAERSCFPVAWLALDERDNDPVRFWISLIAAMRTRLPRAG